MSLKADAPFSIDAADRTHLATLSRLARKIWYQHYPGIITEAQIEYMLARDYALDTLRDDLDRGIWMDIMRIDQEVVGFSAYGPTLTEGEIKLHKLYLLGSRHGQGLGSSLLERAEQNVSKRGFTKIILQVNKNNAKAIRAYERNGYYQQASVVDDIGNGFVMDDYVMAKRL
jgi:ribosomal protein S18 acetylase RimI-like enzyme